MSGPITVTHSMVANGHPDGRFDGRLQDPLSTARSRPPGSSSVIAPPPLLMSVHSRPVSLQFNPLPSVCLPRIPSNLDKHGVLVIWRYRSEMVTKL